MSKRDNIILVGMPGAGKSTLGAAAAHALGYEFVDADVLIQDRFGKTLEEIIAAKGAEGFIQIESDVLRDIDLDHAVVSTGGSAVYSEAAMAHLREIGTVAYLRVSAAELERRLGDLRARGVVMRDGSPATIDDLLAERTPLYERHADVTVDVDGTSVREATQRLLAALS